MKTVMAWALVVAGYIAFGFMVGAEIAMAL